MTDEEAKLDDAMSRDDGVLLASLKREDEERKRRRKVMMIGGLSAIVITTIVVNVVLWMALGGRRGVEGTTERLPQKLDAEEKLAKSEELTVDGWGLWQKGEMAAARLRFKKAVDL